MNNTHELQWSDFQRIAVSEVEGAGIVGHIQAHCEGVDRGLMVLNQSLRGDITISGLRFKLTDFNWHVAFSGAQSSWLTMRPIEHITPASLHGIIKAKKG